MEVCTAPDPLGSVSDRNAISGESYDGSAPSLTGRAVLDREEPVPTKISNKPLNQCIVNCKQNTIISSLNTRTLLPSGRLEELTKNAISMGIDIIAIQKPISSS